MNRMLHHLRQDFWRDLRSGDLTLLILAVALAVGALTAVSLFADRLSGAFSRDAKQLMGGDAVVVTDLPTPVPMLELALQHGLKIVQTAAFPTMARVQAESQNNPSAREEATKLVALKAVETGYPLRGKVKLEGQDGQIFITQQVPDPGTIWVEKSLLAALNVGLNDSMMLGDSRVVIQAVIASEPDRGVGFMNFAPRVMMNKRDLAGTGLVGPASRVTYRLAVAGGESQVAAFVKAAAPLVASTRGARLDSLESGRPETKQILDTTEKFLNLVALLCALVCAAAVAIAARAFAAKRLDDCALRRVLGQSQRQMAIGFGLEFVIVGLLASILGCLLGWGMHQLLVVVLAQVMDTQLPAPTLWPILFGSGVGLTLLLGFGLPPVLQLAGTPPLRVIRRDVGEIKASSLFTLMLGVLAFVALLLVASKDFWLGAMTTAGFAAALLIFASMAWLALRVLALILKRSGTGGMGVMQSPLLRLATRQALAHKLHTVVQITSLSIGLLALLLLMILRGDLLGSWQKARPQDAPDRMVINVLPDQAPAFKDALDLAGIKHFDWYPMFRGRLLAINDVPANAAQYEDDRAKRLVEREFNLSHSAQLPAHNPVVAGRWVDEEADGVSVEEGLAKTLRLKLGDRLRFDVAGQSIEATITSLRKVDWQSMRANFFVLFPKTTMPSVPITYLAAFKVQTAAAGAQNRNKNPVDNNLVKTFPNITLIDLSQSLLEIQNVIQKVTVAVEGLFAFTLLAGLLVLVATLKATSGHTGRDFAVMRALGGTASQLHKIQSIQLAGIGLLAGLLSALVAMTMGWAMAKWIFQFEDLWSLNVLFVGLASGFGLTLLTGYAVLWPVLHRNPLQALRTTG